MGLNGASGAIGANDCDYDFEDDDGYDQWDTPDWSLLRNGQAPAPPLPLQLFDSWAPWIAATARAASAPADYVAFGLLTAVAGVVGNAYVVRPDPERTGWSEPIGLWTVLVGRPSSGKTPALTAIERVLEALDARARQEFEPELERYAARVALAEEADKAWRKQVQDALKKGQTSPERPADAFPPAEVGPPRIMIRSATLEAVAGLLRYSPKGVLQFRDEISGWWGDMTRYSSSSDKPAYLSAYNAGPITMDRVKYGSQPIHVPRALISVLGGTQPDCLAQLLSGPDDGFVARPIYICPEPVELLRSAGAADVNALRDAFARLHSLQLQPDENGELQPASLSFTEDAANLFFEFRQGTRELIRHEEGVLAGWIGKGDGLVARLAAVLSLLEWARRQGAPQPRLIQRQTVERAIILWTDYLLPMAKRAFGEAARSPLEQRATRLLKAIRQRRPAKVNQRDVYKTWGLKDLRDAEPVQETVRYLGEAGWLRPLQSRAGSNAGRLKADWDINPELWR